jgi:hypothetical protein
VSGVSGPHPRRPLIADHPCGLLTYKLHPLTPTTPFPQFQSTVLVDMVPPRLQPSERPNLEKFIKDGKLMMPYNFPFHKQPTKGLYIIYHLILFLVVLPLWILRYALPSWRPRRSWTISQAVGVRAHSPGFLSFHLGGLHSTLCFIREELLLAPSIENWPEDWRLGENARRL